ncbi:MAG: hypothetical protein JNM99_14695 [Verrucomicrobiaceae bacterium]|nr:hypothetical protein [Verrucomicrobiaceae bacterium]
MSETNKIELHRLSKLISDLQMSIFLGGGVSAATTSMLVKALADAQGQLVGVERSEEREQREFERKHEQEVATAAIAAAEREAALSLSEKQEFASFLQCEFFTKTMFDRLDRFYTNTWDRLSDDGKAEMSHRVWEGVRRGEYQFNELPGAVKEREAQRLYEVLRHEEGRDQNLRQIEPQDRNDFKDAWEGQRRDAAFKILARPSFTENVSLRSEAVKSESVTLNSPSEVSKVLNHIAAAPSPESNAKVSHAAGEADLKPDDLLLTNLTPPLPQLKGNAASTKALGD